MSNLTWPDPLTWPSHHDTASNYVIASYLNTAGIRGVTHTIVPFSFPQSRCNIRLQARKTYSWRNRGKNVNSIGLPISEIHELAVKRVATAVLILSCCFSPENIKVHDLSFVLERKNSLALFFFFRSMHETSREVPHLFSTTWGNQPNLSGFLWS